MLHEILQKKMELIVPPFTYIVGPKGEELYTSKQNLLF
jgi:hypothetical protein